MRAVQYTESGNKMYAFVSSVPVQLDGRGKSISLSCPSRGLTRWQQVSHKRDNATRSFVRMQLNPSSASSPTMNGIPEIERVRGVPVLSLPGTSIYRPPWLRILLLAVVFIWTWRRWYMRKVVRETFSRRDLSAQIATFYDKRTEAWESVWGEHLHHGLYFGREGKQFRRKSGTDAQIETMSELLRIGGLTEPSSLPPNAKILDVGCGIGGATRYLARQFPDATVVGVTLSEYQARRATQLNEEAGLSDRVSNIVCDALHTDYEDSSFDLVWALESAEHIEDKLRLVSECKRLLKPGGTLLLLPWCMRESSPRLSFQEQATLRCIQLEYCLPRLAPPSEYATNLRRVGLRNIEEEDWTARAAPFWMEVVRTAAFSVAGLRALRNHGWPLIRSALAMRHVISAIRNGSFKLVAFAARKPTEAEALEEEKRRAALRAC